MWANEPIYEDWLVNGDTDGICGHGSRQNHLGECMQSETRRGIRVELRKTQSVRNEEKKGNLFKKKKKNSGSFE